MGIQGLLPLLKSIQRPTHLKNYAGQTLGIDAYGWLHRGTISCAIELAEGKPTRKHIEFALNRVRMLIHFGVKPYMVFDGDYLPSKTHTEKDRAARRRESKRIGLELLRMDRRSQAHLELQKSIDVTPAMARELIEELKHMGVPYVVAPYEADSQLAYLEKQGVISGVLSEDSDLLVFGVKRLLTKLDQYGECIAVNRDHFTACREVSLVGWSDKDFRLMAMLSGCDYLPGIPGMGLKTAYRLVRKHRTIDRVVRTIQFDGKMKVPSGYMDSFLNAERTFLYQWVFCPQARCLRHLVELPPDVKVADMPYIGKYVEPEVAAGVACGDLDPNTKKPIILSTKLQRPASRAAVMQTPNGKEGKPITSFYKPVREPLAELDVNSLQPSPSQQCLLRTHRNTSWSVSRAPSTQSNALDYHRARQAPSSAPQVPRALGSRAYSANQRSSPKRQRLCSDVGSSRQETSKSEGQQGSTSRFFECHSVQASPSLIASKKSGRKEDFELWSDDSVADAIAAATSTPMHTHTCSISSPRKRKKLEVFADSPNSIQSVAEDDASHLTTLSAASAESRVSEDGVTPNTSFDSSAPIPRCVSSMDVVAALSESVTAGSTPPTQGSQSPGVLTTQELSTASTLTKFALPIDLHEEDTKGNLMIPFDFHDQSTPEHHDKDSDDINNNNDNDEDGADLSAAANPLLEEREASSQSTMKREEYPPAKGSEDLLVPRSPEYDDEDDGDGRTRPKLHLDRFAYAG